MDLELIRNYQEQAVADQIKVAASRYPALCGNPGLLSDVACVALNSLKPRYVKHRVDMHFFETSSERTRNEAAVRMAVDDAFEFVSRRTDRAAAEGLRRSRASR